jgi:hypothetical protein
MKNIDFFENELLNTHTVEPGLESVNNNSVTKAGRQLRKIIGIAGIAAFGLCLNACTSTGYVESEPTYVEYSRPQQPSNNHVWINGDWVYSNQTHAYKQKNGYWHKPHHSQTYVAGHWQSSPKGYYWKPGYYQKHNH